MVGILLVISLLILPATADLLTSPDSQIPFNDILAGYRNEGQLYTWSIKNVSGTADIVYHYTVYASRLIGTNYTFHSKEWNSWEVEDAAAGSQYLIVWVRGWLDEDSRTSWIGWGPERFNAWVWSNQTIAPEPVRLEDMPITYKSEKYRPAMIGESFNRTDGIGEILTSEWYGWNLWDELDRMTIGYSNR